MQGDRGHGSRQLPGFCTKLSDKHHVVHYEGLQNKVEDHWNIHIWKVLYNKPVLEVVEEVLPSREEPRVFL